MIFATRLSSYEERFRSLELYEDFERRYEDEMDRDSYKQNHTTIGRKGMQMHNSHQSLF